MNSISDDLLAALLSADQWIKLLVDEADIDPDETIVTVKAVGSDGKRPLAEMNLAESQKQFAAAIARAQSEQQP